MRYWIWSLPLLVACPESDKDDGERVELCNGKDDNGDGAIDEGFDDVDVDGIADCVDDACGLDLPAAGSAAVTEACNGETVGEVTDPWEISEFWDTEMGSGTYAPPSVGNLTDDNGDGVVDGDDVPEVAVVDLSGNLVVMSGDDGSKILELPDYWSYGGAMIADVDGDGTNEVVAVDTSYKLHALNGAGEEVWTSAELTVAMNYPIPVGADLEGDGTAELVILNNVVSGADGALLQTLDMPSSPYWVPVIADLDLDGYMEIIIAEQVFDHEGNLLWEGPVSTYGQFASVLNADDDDEGEVFFVTDSEAHLYDTDGTELAEFEMRGTNAGPSCVADFDGDGTSEIVFPAGTQLQMMELDGTINWFADILDSSGLAGCSGYDFNADGAYEVLFAGESTLDIYDGKTGEVLWDHTHASGTVFEYPVVADIDADGSAEIVVSTNYGASYGVSTYEQATATWPPSGQGWPSHDWGGTNILDDGSIPADPDPSWLTNNLFRARPLGEAIPSADLAVTLVDFCVVSCREGPLSIGYQVSNQGVEDVPAGVPMSLYALGDDEPYLVTTITLDAIPAGQALEGQTIDTLPSYFGPLGFTLRVDDDGEGGTSIRDCDRSNNTVTYTGAVCEL